MVKKILIVDDSVVAQNIMKKCLPAETDFEISLARDGKEGVDKVKEFCPDLTFLDLTMPVMSGFEALVTIKKDFPDAIVIICTADVQKKVLEKVINDGALMVIMKPPSKETVRAAIEKAEDALQSRGT